MSAETPCAVSGFAAQGVIRGLVTPGLKMADYRQAMQGVTDMAKANGSTTSTPRAPKTKQKCELTLEQFREKATALKVTVAGKDMVANKKEFSTGSLGWFAGEKIVVEIDGVPCKVQVGINLTIIGSKPSDDA